MNFWKLHGVGNDFIAIDGRFDNKVERKGTHLTLTSSAKEYWPVY